MAASAARTQKNNISDEIAAAQSELFSGDPAAAAARLESAAASSPAPLAYYWLSAAHGALGDLSRQRECLKQARRLHGVQIISEAGGDLARMQRDGAYASYVAAQFYNAKQMGAASVAFMLAANAPNRSAEALLRLGLSLQHQGRMEEAVEAFQLATDAAPSPAVHEFLLYALFFAENGVVRHAREVRRWADKYAPPLDRDSIAFLCERNPHRRLKIGYVAASFVGTQVKQFFMPALDRHDRTAFDISLYAENAAAEGDLPAEIVSIGGLNDAEACARIRQDGIDVLVDLWGHTSGGRLGVFARRAAPVQVAWINYLQSTGLTAMDYVLHADSMRTPDIEDFFVERIWSLGPTNAPFRPAGPPAEGPTPALHNGFARFACFNHPAKISDQCIAAWARILIGAPTARLLLKYGYYADPTLRNAMCVRFAAHGVKPSQLEFSGHSAGPDYLRAFADIDVALDPSPCPGGTTSCDAIASGVPLLALRGTDFYARLSLQHLEPLGLHELIADSWDDYVAKAVDLTRDHARLDALRQKTRAAFAASPFRDEAGFTRRLEAAYRAMFSKWCEPV